MLFRRAIAVGLAIALTSGTMMAQTAGSTAPRVRVTSEGKRMSGRLIAVDANNVTIHADDRPDSILVPLSLVTVVEVSRGKRPRWLAGVLAGAVGLAAGVGTAMLIALGNRGRGICEGCTEMIVVGSVVGGSSGLVTAFAVRRERWRSVPLSSLASLVAN